MITIQKQPVESATPIVIDHSFPGFPYDHRKPEVQLSYDDEGILVKFTVFEKDPRRLETQHLKHVHLDSCVEFFVNFAPADCDRYINFEANANGTMNVAFRKNREEKTPLTIEDIESLHITPVLYDEYWTLSYRIGFDLIHKYYPTFDIEKKPTFLGNLYKCGDETEQPHYFMVYPIDLPKPDFQRPEFFGEFKII